MHSFKFYGIIMAVWISTDTIIKEISKRKKIVSKHVDMWHNLLSLDKFTKSNRNPFHGSRPPRLLNAPSTPSNPDGRDGLRRVTRMGHLVGLHEVDCILEV